MRILAIDPGTSESAWVQYETATESVVASGFEANELILSNMRAGLFGGEHLAIEMIACYGMSVGKETFETCLWIGRFIEAWRKYYTLVYRLDVKMHLCKSPRAKDTNIRQALIDRFGEPGTKKQPGKLYGITKHRLAALAVGVTFADRMAGQAA